MRTSALVRFSCLVVLSAPALAAQAVIADQLPVPDPDPGANYGTTVAVSGLRAVVGAPIDDDVGAAYVYVRTPSGWEFERKLSASDPGFNDRFGISVAIDDDVIVVGASNDTTPLAAQGSAYVFERSGTTWTQTAKLLANDAAANDAFGIAVDVEDGTILVGAWNTTQGGAAYAFENVLGGWSQTDKLTPLDPGSSDFFGASVSLSGDRALIGSPLEDQAQQDAGAVYFFTRSGSTWSQAQKLTALDAVPFAQFGYTADLDGGSAVVGAFADGTPLSGQRGAAYFYDDNGSSFTFTTKVRPLDNATGDQFGVSVALDDETAIVGAYLDDDAAQDSGSAYVYRRSPSGWQEAEKLRASDPSLSDWFGYDVAVDADVFVAGALQNDAPDADSGSAYTSASPLTGAPAQVSLGAGGTQTLFLQSPANPTLPYVVLGSFGGTTPGFPLDGFLLPLVLDSYFFYTLTSANMPPLAGSFGLLDANGRGAATFNVPPGTAPQFAGIEVNHAFVVLELLPNLLRINAVSNPVPVLLTP